MIYSMPKNPSTHEMGLLAVMKRDVAILRERAARSNSGIRIDGESSKDRRAIRLSPYRGGRRNARS
jgi:hypothetical protein